MSLFFSCWSCSFILKMNVSAVLLNELNTLTFLLSFKSSIVIMTFISFFLISIQLDISLSKSSWKIQVFKENWCEFDMKILTQYNIAKAIIVFIIFLINMSRIKNSDCRYFDSVELVRHDWMNWDHIWCIEKTILKYLFIIILSLMLMKIERWLQLDWASICLDERTMKSYAHICRVEENKWFDKNDSSSLVIIDLHFKVILRVK